MEQLAYDTKMKASFGVAAFGTEKLAARSYNMLAECCQQYLLSAAYRARQEDHLASAAI